jgi:hypothetical protein
MGGGGFWILGSFRCLGRERQRETCTALGENGEKGRESDLKAGHARPKNEYVQPESC